MGSLLVLILFIFFGQSINAIDDNQNDRDGGYVYQNIRPSQYGKIPEWDPNGYVFFCLCMGRMGNQADHFLGAMAFAKALNRTLILPPFRTYRNIQFTEWFKFEAVEEYHRAVLAEDFMEYLAPEHWPPSKRIGFCWLPPNSKEKCNMKPGNPFRPFWDGLDVHFVDHVIYHLSYYPNELPKWNIQYPPEKYPVLAFKGAPAHFPVRQEHKSLQRYLVFSDRVTEEAQRYVDKYFKDEPFVGIHLRNGVDWKNACQHAEGNPSYMASPQCLHGTGKSVTQNMCFPSKSEVLRLTKNVIISTKAKVIFVATDKMPMVKELEEHLKSKNVRVYHMDPHLPLIDLEILIRSDHFIGNCVSSFTAFVARARDVQGKPTSFWGFS